MRQTAPVFERGQAAKSKEKPMQMRQLGRSGIALPPIMIGGNVFGWTADEAMSFRLLDRAAEAGLTAIDTADVYSRWVAHHQGGESETVIGAWMKQRGNRNSLTIATKVGMEMGPDSKGLSAKWIAKAVDNSLRRLQTDRIDLYQAHRDDETTPLDETLQAFATLIESGKVRAIGASNYSGARLSEALAISTAHNLPRFESIQPLYNLMERADFETDLAALCVREQIGVIPYYALAAGFLTGKYRTKQDLGQSPRGGKVEKYLNGQGATVIETLGQIGKTHDAAISEVALAWLASRPGVTAPIASATRLEQMESLIRAATLRLSTQDIETLNTVSAV
jgi:aryl-alcohol dehydrogenase-like predicted oxidoreductase